MTANTGRASTIETATRHVLPNGMVAPGFNIQRDSEVPNKGSASSTGSWVCATGEKNDAAAKKEGDNRFI